MNINRNPKVVSFSPFAFWRLHSLYEVAICHNLKWRGYPVNYVICDGLFSDCDMFWESTCGPRPDNACTICQSNVKHSLTDLGIQPTPLSKYQQTDHNAIAKEFIEQIKDNELLEVLFDGYQISNYIKSSVHSHLRINSIDLDNQKHRSTLRSYIYSGIIALVLIRKMLSVEQPSIVLLFNGRLAVTRIALELCKELGIRVVCHERGIETESLLLWENESCLSLRPYKELAESWRNIPLTATQFARIVQWLDDRQKGKNLNWKAFSVEGSMGEVGAFINRNPGRKILGLFTSSTDELVAEDEFKSAFGTQQDWIQHNINFARSNPEIVLLIRVHPNSGSKKSNGVNHDEIIYFNGLKKTLPENVHIVSADNHCSSYALLNNISVGLVYASTIGLEIACRGIPVICAANSPWVFCDAIHKINSHSEYDDLLSALIMTGTTRENCYTRIRAAMRFAYALVYRWGISFPLIRMPNPHTGILDCRSVDSFRPGKHFCLDYCVDILLGARSSVPIPIYPISRTALDQETISLDYYFNALVEINSDAFQSDFLPKKMEDEMQLLDVELEPLEKTVITPEQDVAIKLGLQALERDELAIALEHYRHAQSLGSSLQDLDIIVAELEIRLGYRSK
jgi:hypothetical protein